MFTRSELHHTYGFRLQVQHALHTSLRFLAPALPTPDSDSGDHAVKTTAQQQQRQANGKTVS